MTIQRSRATIRAQKSTWEFPWRLPISRLRSNLSANHPAMCKDQPTIRQVAATIRRVPGRFMPHVNLRVSIKTKPPSPSKAKKDPMAKIFSRRELRGYITNDNKRGQVVVFGGALRLIELRGRRKLRVRRRARLAIRFARGRRQRRFACWRSPDICVRLQAGL